MRFQARGKAVHVDLASGTVDLREEALDLRGPGDRRAQRAGDRRGEFLEGRSGSLRGGARLPAPAASLDDSLASGSMG